MQVRILILESYHTIESKVFYVAGSKT